MPAVMDDVTAEILALKQQREADWIREAAPQLVARLLARGETRDADPKS